ncbi:ROK family transcriptional regulator [Marinovum sp.]|uniref:ROK family transcriptional regulator n=1 Tax=Marinovum sp. TaxID=2024839 RepID=UPI002B274988|nr:ROK family transcriptional regulator [Marinovum sp.]
MTQDTSRSFSSGVNQSGVRDYNERLLLSMIQRHGPMPGSDMARQSSLSAQTVSVILRSLEADGLLVKGEPQRGRVGKPRIPMALNPAGSFAFGLKIGRRSADLALMDLTGEVRAQMQIQYHFPDPDKMLTFLGEGIESMSTALDPEQRKLICGIGIAAPFEMWKRHDIIGADDRSYDSWQGRDLVREATEFTELPITLVNDATSACYAENTFGQGRRFRDYAYFFIGAFAGGGVVMNGAVFEGPRDNAGALGSIITRDAEGRPAQLMDRASIFWLETAIREAGGDPAQLWSRGADWATFEDQLGPWIEMAAQELAMAALSCCAVIDFEAVLVDGAFPAAVRSRLVRRMSELSRDIETIGLFRPEFAEGSVGANARVLGAAYRPIASQYFLGSGGLTAAR